MLVINGSLFAVFPRYRRHGQNVLMDYSIPGPNHTRSDTSVTCV